MVRNQSKLRISKIERKKMKKIADKAYVTKMTKVTKEKQEEVIPGVTPTQVKKQTEIVIMESRVRMIVKGEYTEEENMYLDRMNNGRKITEAVRNGEYKSWVMFNMKELVELQSIFVSPSLNELCNHVYHTRSIKGIQPMEERGINLDHMMDYCYYNDLEFFKIPYDFNGHSDKYIKWVHTIACPPTIVHVEDEGWIHYSGKR
jgi:hypothetical protein